MTPFKSIAVAPPKRGGPRKQPLPMIVEQAQDSPALQVALAGSPRRLAASPVHRYRVGDRLRMNGGGYSVQRAASGCKVVALLPYEGYGALLYRVRSEVESFERIVAEADLVR
jgi:hypothetical protein